MATHTFIGVGIYSFEVWTLHEGFHTLRASLSLNLTWVRPVRPDCCGNRDDITTKIVPVFDRVYLQYHMRATLPCKLFDGHCLMAECSMLKIPRQPPEARR